MPCYKWLLISAQCNVISRKQWRTYRETQVCTFNRFLNLQLLTGSTFQGSGGSENKPRQDGWNQTQASNIATCKSSTISPISAFPFLQITLLLHLASDVHLLGLHCLNCHTKGKAWSLQTFLQFHIHVGPMKDNWKPGPDSGLWSSWCHRSSYISKLQTGLQLSQIKITFTCNQWSYNLMNSLIGAIPRPRHSCVNQSIPCIVAIILVKSIVLSQRNDHICTSLPLFPIPFSSSPPLFHPPLPTLK